MRQNCLDYLMRLFLILCLSSVFLAPSAHAIAEELLTADAMLSNDTAQDNDDGTNDASDTSDSSTIESNPALVNDAEIGERIRSIFAEVDGLSAVTVRVNEGVVKLGGETANEKKAIQAVKLASRVSQVVTVEDSISRTLDVQDNVTPVLNNLYAKAKGWLKAVPLLLVAMLAFGLIAWFGSWLANRNALWQRITPNPFVAELLAQTAKVIFIILGLILGLSLMGAEAIIGTLLGGAGVLGIAVGFAVKDTIENYIASLMLSVRQPFRSRDHVVINDHEGIVVRLTSRATILMTPDGNHLRLPNSEVFKGTILNYSKNPERRFTFELGVDANNDPLAAIKVGLDAVSALDFVLNEPKAVAVIREVGDSNIVLEFQIWVNQTQTDFSKARSIAIRETKHALENNGFSLPEPIYMLNFDQSLENAVIDLANVLKPKHTEQTALTDYPNTQSNNTQHTKSLLTDNDMTNTEHNIAITHGKINHITDTQRQKQIAKERAKKILAGEDIDAVLDTAPDPNLLQKVEAEIKDNDGEKDLLNHNSPQE